MLSSFFKEFSGYSTCGILWDKEKCCAKFSRIVFEWFDLWDFFPKQEEMLFIFLEEAFGLDWWIGVKNGKKCCPVSLNLSGSLLLSFSSGKQEEMTSIFLHFSGSLTYGILWDIQGEMLPNISRNLLSNSACFFFLQKQEETLSILIQKVFSRFDLWDCVKDRKKYCSIFLK